MDVYKIITDRIIKQLEQGTIPWRKVWNGKESMPKNGSTGKEYRGINVFMLALSGSTHPEWFTFNQIKALGGSVKKGAESNIVCYFNFLDSPQETEEVSSDKMPVNPNRVAFLKYYRVFNFEQTEGISSEWDPKSLSRFEKIKNCEDVIEGYLDKPEIRHSDYGRCYYKKSLDYVHMPKPEFFESTKDYYSVLFHELGHSTGHEKRLNRKSLTKKTKFGSSAYSKEELIAEMTQAFLSGHCGIDTQKNQDLSASYIKGWLSKLKNNKRLVITAATQAQKSTDYILKREGKLN